MKRRVIEHGSYRMPAGMVQGLIIPTGWYVEEWDAQKHKWLRVAICHPNDAYALAGFKSKNILTFIKNKIYCFA